MSKFNPYSNEQTSAAIFLAEITLADIDTLNDFTDQFTDTLDDCDDEDAPIYCSMIKTNPEIGFINNFDDPNSLIVNLANLALRHNAILTFGNDPYFSISNSQSIENILLITQRELEQYNYSLLLFPINEEFFGAFMCRQMDIDLAQKLSLKCNAQLITPDIFVEEFSF